MKLTSLGAKVQIVQISSNVAVQYFGRVKKNSFFRRFEVMTDFCNISFVPKAQRGTENPGSHELNTQSIQDSIIA